MRAAATLGKKKTVQSANSPGGSEEEEEERRQLDVSVLTGLAEIPLAGYTGSPPANS